MVKKTTAKDGDHVVTMREVAKAAGVSIKTVSNVVNDYEFVSDATRAKVHKAIDELGYVINVSARNLRRGSTGIIALAIPDLQLSYFAQLSSLIITEAKKLGLRVIVEPTLYSREGELDALHGSQTAMVDGLIYSPLELGPDDAAEVEVDYPLVLIGERIFTDKVDHIATENVEGAKRATSYLLQTGCKRVAVVGSGPAGLTAARFAALLGHAVTVYESAPVMGGVPRHAVPDFRLPKDVVDRETGAIVASGVQVRTNVTVGRDITLQSLLDTYDAAILAVGLWKERRLDIPGKEHLVPAVGWLKRSTLERQSLAGKTVVILGGGGVAFDCAFTARRLNADAVHIVCLEPTDAMRAPAEEVQQALDEGIVIHNSHLSHAVAPEGGRLRFEARPVTSFSFDETGALHTEFAPGDPLCMNADLVICASGLQTDEIPLEGVDMARTPRGFVAVDPVSFRTSVPGLYAAGDIANGPSLIALLPPATARNWRLPNSPAGSRPKLPLPRPDAVCIAATAWNAVHAWKAAPDTSSK